MPSLPRASDTRMLVTLPTLRAEMESRTTSSTATSTIRVDSRETRVDSGSMKPSGRLRVHATSFTRPREEDKPGDDVSVARALEDGTFIAVVADGLGSARQGRDAAEKAVAHYAANFRNRPRAWSPTKTLEEITRHLNRQLHQEGLARHESPELASTVVAAVLDGDRLHVLNVGDSRAYRLRVGKLERLSHDHRDATQTHVLTQALGLADTVAPHLAHTDLAVGDLILLCTDGLTDVLDDTTLTELLTDRTGARGLVAIARDHATPETLDDITTVVLEVQELGPTASAAPVALPIPAQLKVGDQADGYTLRRSFRASDRIWLAAKAGKSFVLKFAPREAQTNEAILTAFIRETWNATTLKADYFPAATAPEEATARYYVLEYFHAPTLKQWLADNGPLPTADAVVLGKFVLAAAQFLLRHDFVHGDLKPENILVLGEPGALAFKLIDLGNVAEVFSVNSRAGTPSYLAPERFRNAAVSETTEIFALGATLYEALTGKLPHGEIEPFQTPQFRPAKPPSKLNPHVPHWLDAIVLRALALDPADRFAAYSEMRFQLEHPEKVKPFRSAGAPLMERDPLLLLKLLLAASVAANIALLFLLLHK
ncbi:MAG: bifunctional protein-serine/threonine kinase/phosphatase [Verrucomicrobia bacterium]|nr:bifunctional protein-serine/threonine kinase/phosphatase [Verrucomicrobiota bacterium]